MQCAGRVMALTSGSGRGNRTRAEAIAGGCARTDMHAQGAGRLRIDHGASSTMRRRIRRRHALRRVVMPAAVLLCTFDIPYLIYSEASTPAGDTSAADTWLATAQPARGACMKICVYGAGAIGGYLGVALAEAGADVSLVARGPASGRHAANGVRLQMARRARRALRLHRRSGRARVQDYVIVALKAHSVPASSSRCAPLLGPDTRIVTAVNGIPYWYFHKHGGDLEGSTRRSRRSRRQAMARSDAGARDRLRRLSRDRNRRAGRHPARLRRQVPPGRAGRQRVAAS